VARADMVHHSSTVTASPAQTLASKGSNIAVPSEEERAAASETRGPLGHASVKGRRVDCFDCTLPHYGQAIAVLPRSAVLSRTASRPRGLRHRPTGLSFVAGTAGRWDTSGCVRLARPSTRAPGWA